MKIYRAYKVELAPNNKQRSLLNKNAGAARFTWNWGLERRMLEYSETGKHSDSIKQNRELTVLKKTEFSWMYEVSSRAILFALQDLDRAYKNFFRRVKAGEKPGFPKFKSKHKGNNSFKVSESIYLYRDKIQLPRLGLLRLKESGYIPTSGVKILSATCSEIAGHWFVSVNVEQEVLDPISATGPAIGVDLGIKSMAVVSDGRTFENPKPLRKNLKRLKRLSGTLSRKQKGSRNRAKAKLKLARLHYRISCIRKDSLHKATTSICARTKPESCRPCVIVLEDLNLRGMLENHKLALAISELGLGEFRRQVEYKSRWDGEHLQLADRFFPSSKICSACGRVNKELILSQRMWTCSSCNTKHDRDLNAAINLQNLAVNTGSFSGINAYGQDTPLRDLEEVGIGHQSTA